MTIEEYNRKQERVREHNPLWMIGKWCKVPFGREINEFKMISIQQSFGERSKVKKPNPPPQRGWWYR